MGLVTLNARLASTDDASLVTRERSTPQTFVNGSAGGDAAGALGGTWPAGHSVESRETEKDSVAIYDEN
jgi:hypothetical protein